MNYKSDILQYCRELGLDTVGFTKCRVFIELKAYFQGRKEKLLENEFEEKDIDKRINPFLFMRDGKTIISIAFPYLFNKEFKDDIGFSKYTQGKDYHTVVSGYLEKVCSFIKKLGGKAEYFVDSNSLPERYIAMLCGVGFIGKNNNITTEKYGSYVFLGEIITNISIEADKPSESKCGSCDICKKACPTGSIKDENNPNVCLSYITQKKDIEDEWFSKFNGRVFGCDTCQIGCPYNRKICLSDIDDFKPLPFMENINLEQIVKMDKRIFREKYSGTSCGWRGKNVLQRNVLINILSLNKNVTIGEIKSPYIENYYDRLLKLFKL